MTWAAIAEYLRLMGEVLKRTDGTNPTLAVHPAPADVESQTDEFVRHLLRDPEFVDYAPMPVRPWLLARVICAQVVASELAERGEALPNLPTRRIVELLLIHDWHKDLKHRWPQVLRSDDQGLAE
jgi:hypothetical protein